MYVRKTTVHTSKCNAKPLSIVTQVEFVRRMAVREVGVGRLGIRENHARKAAMHVAVDGVPRLELVDPGDTAVGVHGRLDCPARHMRSSSHPMTSRSRSSSVALDVGRTVLVPSARRLVPRKACLQMCEVGLGRGAVEDAAAILSLSLFTLYERVTSKQGA